MDFWRILVPIFKILSAFLPMYMLIEILSGKMLGHSFIIVGGLHGHLLSDYLSLESPMEERLKNSFLVWCSFLH